MRRKLAAFAIAALALLASASPASAASVDMRAASGLCGSVLGEDLGQATALKTSSGSIRFVSVTHVSIPDGTNVTASVQNDFGSPVVGCQWFDVENLGTFVVTDKVVVIRGTESRFAMSDVSSVRIVIRNNGVILAASESIPI